MTDFEQAVEYAAWWTRYALDLAADADPHPGVVGHLTAARTQHDAVERLMPTPPAPLQEARAAA